ncbi:RHS repeat protein [Dyella tabacisoli]|nr:RHS repeat protein [Dyella tabacisoli]
MRALLFSVLALASASASAEDYYYVLSAVPPLADIHYPSPDAACHAAYDYQTTGPMQSLGFTVVFPYKDPTITLSQPPKYLIYGCVIGGQNPKTGEVATPSYGITRKGDGCTPKQTYNPQTGYCESPDQDQARKELGDPSDPLVSGIVSCGDPINAGIGNLFESETDYQDSDGELRYVRNYNSAKAGWLRSYTTSLYIDSKGLSITFEDGRSSLFTLSNGVATPEATELGAMTQVNGLWVYTSPTNEQFSFDAQGHLTRWQQANGLAQTLTYGTAANGDVITTITDSRGHTLQFTRSNYGVPKGFVANGLAVAYTFDTSSRLTTVTRTWPGHTATRTYAYEDTHNPRLLTGIIDERGVRYATWTYDAQGRALSSEHAKGAEKTTMTYNSDGSTTVTNALGNTAVYTYQVIQGVKRVTAIQGSPAAGCPASNSSYTYTANGQVQTKTDALGHVTAYTYDTLGRELTRIEAQGTPQERTTTTTWYDTRFLPKTVTTSDRVTTYTYDTQGRLQSTSVHAIKG